VRVRESIHGFLLKNCLMLKNDYFGRVRGPPTRAHALP